MSDTRAILGIDRQVWREFEGECLLRGHRAIAVLHTLLKNQLSQWADDANREAPRTLPSEENGWLGRGWRNGS